MANATEVSAKFQSWADENEAQDFVDRVKMNAEAPEDNKGVIPWLAIFQGLLALFASNCKPTSQDSAAQRIRKEAAAARKLAKDHAPVKVRAMLNSMGQRSARKQDGIYLAFVSQSSSELDTAAGFVYGYAEADANGDFEAGDGSDDAE